MIAGSRTREEIDREKRKWTLHPRHVCSDDAAVEKKNIVPRQKNSMPAPAARKYKDLLEHGWMERNANRRRFGLVQFKEPSYDPIDDMVDSSYDHIQLHEVREEYLYEISWSASIIIMTEEKTDDLNSVLGERRRRWNNLSVLDVLCDDSGDVDMTDEKIRPEARKSVTDLFLRLRERPPSLKHMPNKRVPLLRELAIKALSLATNFKDILRVKGFHAVSFCELSALERFLSDNLHDDNGGATESALPKIASPFALVLSPKNKLLVYKSFYIVDFGEESEVQADEESLTTTIQTRYDDVHLLSQMYYLQPQRIETRDDKHVVHWGASDVLGQSPGTAEHDGETPMLSSEK